MPGKSTRSFDKRIKTRVKQVVYMYLRNNFFQLSYKLELDFETAQQEKQYNNGNEHACSN